MKAPLFILIVFIISFVYVILYEFILIYIPGTEASFKAGLIFSKISYSIIAASIFYLFAQYIPVYLPTKKKKIKIIYEVHFNTLMLDSLIKNLALNLDIQNEEDYKNKDLFQSKLDQQHPDDAVDSYKNWYEYLFVFKNRLLDIIKSISPFHEFLNIELLEELLIIEKQLYKPNIFDGTKSFIELSYAEIELQEIFVHNKHLQDLSFVEFKKYEKIFNKLGKEYRQKYYHD
jgi:hypothetical protein